MAAERADKDPVVLDHHRRQQVTAIHLSDTDEDGARLLTLETNTPDTFLVLLPEEACNYFKERLNGGITVAGAVDLARIREQKGD